MGPAALADVEAILAQLVAGGDGEDEEAEPAPDPAQYAGEHLPFARDAGEREGDEDDAPPDAGGKGDPGPPAAG